MTSFPVAGSAIYAKLSAAAGVIALVSTRIYEDQAPPNTTTPYCVYYLTSGLWANSTPRNDFNWVYTVDAVATTQDDARNVQAAVFETLHGQTVTIPGWSPYWLVCERVTSLPELIDGKQYWRKALDFRLKASEV